MLRPSVARAGFYQRVDNLQAGKTSCAACNRWGEKKEKIKHFFSFPPAGGGKKKEKSNIFSLFSPQRRYEEIFGCSLFLESNMFEKKLSDFAFPLA